MSAVISLRFPSPPHKQVWNQLRKKPLSVVHSAHGPGAGRLHGGPSAGCCSETNPGTGTVVVPDSTGWVQAVAVCHNSDLVASGGAQGDEWGTSRGGVHSI